MTVLALMGLYLLAVAGLVEWLCDDRGPGRPWGIVEATLVSLFWPLLAGIVVYYELRHQARRQWRRYGARNR